MNDNPGILGRMINFFRDQRRDPSTDLAEGRSLSSVSAQVDDSAGWSASLGSAGFGSALTGRPHDYDPSRVQEIYTDALEAWRKNPIAWRIIAIITDYVIGDEFYINSSNQKLNKFIKNFWFHPKNNMQVRLESMSVVDGKVNLQYQYRKRPAFDWPVFTNELSEIAAPAQVEIFVG